MPIAVDPGTTRFDPLDWADKGHSLEVAHEEAKAARSSMARQIRADYPGKFKLRMTSLPGQLKQYKSFGVSDGRTRTVYYLHIEEIAK